jgi:predicted nucleotidyltransferase
MERISKQILDKISGAIVRSADPLSVIFLGSRSNGNAADDSDIDILVIGEPTMSGTWNRRRHVGNIRRSLPDVGVPIDVLFFTPTEVARWRDSSNHVIHHALAQGRVLYERS